MKAVFKSILLCVFALEGLACSCAFTQEVSEEYEKRDLVIIGKVLSKKWVETEEKGFYLVEIEIREAFKTGQVKTNETVFVRTGPRLPSCGFWFEEGKTYAIYADAVSDHFETSQCTRTTGSWRGERKIIKTYANKT